MCREALRARQIEEHMGLEEAHMAEFQQLNALWDERMQDYSRKVRTLM